MNSDRIRVLQEEAAAVNSSNQRLASIVDELISSQGPVQRPDA